MCSANQIGVPTCLPSASAPPRSPHRRPAQPEPLPVAATLNPQHHIAWPQAAHASPECPLLTLQLPGRVGKIPKRVAAAEVEPISRGPKYICNHRCQL